MVNDIKGFTNLPIGILGGGVDSFHPAAPRSKRLPPVVNGYPGAPGVAVRRWEPTLVPAYSIYIALHSFTQPYTALHKLSTLETPLNNL